MRDHFELVELGMYVIGVTLLMPFLITVLGRENPWVIRTFICFLGIFFLYCARLRIALTQKLDLFCERFAFTIFRIGIVGAFLTFGNWIITWMEVRV